MSRQALEITLQWVAVGCYILASVGLTFSAVFGSPRGRAAGLWMAAVGLVPHGVAIGMRWAATGHGPYLLRYEVLTSNAFVAVAMLTLVLWRRPGWTALAVPVLPIAIFSVALGLFSSTEINDLPPAARSVWLTFHIIFAKISASAFLISLGSAILLLLRQRASPPRWIERAPQVPALDAIVVRSTSFGFIFWTVTIAAGAVWGNELWGRYWGWDPIETWALVAWLTYGSFLHVRFFFKPGPRATAWLSVACFTIFILALMIVPAFINSLHNVYFTS